MSSTSNTTQSGTQSSSTNPSALQLPYLTTALQGANTALNTAQANSVTPSQSTAQYTPDQLAAFQAMLNYGTGNTSIPGTSANAGSAASAAGANGVTAGLTGLNAFTPQGGTQSNINNANAYVAGANIPAQVKAEMLGANQEASDITLPSIARDAAGSGNINSSRNAIQQGIVQRGLAQQSAADATNLTANAYNTGLGLSEQNNEATNNENLAALLGETTGGANTINSGTAANTGAVGQQSGIFNIANAGVTGQNTAAQAVDTNATQQQAAQANDPFTALMNYLGIVGGNQYGTTTSGSSNVAGTSTPSTLQTIGGLLGSAGSFFSDRRIKKDIHLIGELYDGLPVYRFRYKDDPTNTLHMGLMAQDVEEVYPDAVTEIDGVKLVNYDLATVNSMVE